MQEAKVVEVVLFKLNEGVTVETFVASAAVTEEKVRQYSGFIKRQLSQGEDGQWLDLLWWESLEEAHQAAENIMQDTSCVPFMQAINPDTMQMFHMNPIALAVGN
jgi:hypothetical protein